MQDILQTTMHTVLAPQSALPTSSSQSLFPATISTTLNAKQSTQQRNTVSTGSYFSFKPSDRDGRWDRRPRRKQEGKQWNHQEMLHVLKRLTWQRQWAAAWFSFAGLAAFTRTRTLPGVGWGGVGLQWCARNQTAPKARVTLKNKGKTT